MYSDLEVACVYAHKRMITCQLYIVQELCSITALSPQLVPYYDMDFTWGMNNSLCVKYVVKQRHMHMQRHMQPATPGPGSRVMR